MNQLQHWDADKFGVLNLDSVRARHKPEHKFRIQQRRSNPYPQFPSIEAVSKAIYVISGSMEVASEEGLEVLVIRGNQFVDLAPGRYLITYVEAVEWIYVLELPPQVWRVE
jgi:hypothetical protein